MILSRFGMEEGAKNVTSPFVEVWMFEPQKCLSFFFGDSQSSKTHRENYTQRKAWFWTLGIEAKQKIRYKVGPYDLTTPMTKGERTQQKPAIYKGCNPIYWYMAHLIRAVIFHLSGSIHPYFLMASIWFPKWWALVIGQQQSLASMGMDGNGIFTYIFFRKSQPSMQVNIYNTWMVWGTWYTATIRVSAVSACTTSLNLVLKHFIPGRKNLRRKRSTARAWARSTCETRKGWTNLDLQRGAN